MNAKELFYNWGINAPEVDYWPEYLISRFPNNCFFIDSLPLAVDKENSIKFDQVEKQLYGGMQEKILNIAIRLWLYCDVCFESDLFFQEQVIAKIKNLFPNLYEDLCITFPLQVKRDLVLIKDVEQLKILFELSYKDVIDLSLYFSQYQMMITPSWSCFFTFINVNSNIEFIQKIVNVEGLHLRKSSKC